MTHAPQTSRDRAPREVRLFRRTLAKVLVFVLVCSAAGVLIVGTLSGETGGQTDTYNALFSDVSGLTQGDPVRAAGVTVGKVQQVDLLDADRIRITFTANRDQDITDATFAQIRYANLLGQRFLALTSTGKPGAVVKPGGTIPQTRTTPAVSLTALLNGFRPLFQSLDANQVNQLMGDLVNVLQGQTNRIDTLLARTAELTTNLADRSGLIAQVVDSLSTLVTTVASRDDQFAASVTDLKNLTTYLAGDSKNIGSALTSLGSMTQAVDGLVKDTRDAGLDNLIGNLNTIAGTLGENTGKLQKTIDAFPQTFAALDRVTQSGTWANGYPCFAGVRTTGDPKVSGQDIGDALAAFLGLSKNNLLSTVLAVLHLGNAGASIPVEVPQGPIGSSDSSTAVCR